MTKEKDQLDHDALILARKNSDFRKRFEDRPYVMMNVVQSINGSTIGGPNRSVYGNQQCSSKWLSDRAGKIDSRYFIRHRGEADLLLTTARSIMREKYDHTRVINNRNKPVPFAILDRSGVLSDDFTKYKITAPILPYEGQQKHMYFTSQLPTTAVGINHLDIHVVNADMLVEYMFSCFNRMEDVNVVMYEGGATLAAELMFRDLIDEINITVSPVYAVSSDPPVIYPFDIFADMRLAYTTEYYGTVFMSYVRTSFIAPEV